MKIHKWPVGVGDRVPNLPMPHSSPTCPLHDGGWDSLFILPYLHHLLFFTLQFSFSFASFDLSTSKYERNYIVKVFCGFSVCVSHMPWSFMAGLGLWGSPSLLSQVPPRMGWGKGAFQSSKRGRVGREEWVSLTANGQRSKVGRDSLLHMVRPLLSVRFGEEVSPFCEGLAAIWFNGVTMEGPPCQVKVRAKTWPPACCHSGTAGRGLASCPIKGVAGYVRVSACRRRSSVGRGWRGLRAGSHSLPQRSRSPFSVSLKGSGGSAASSVSVTCACRGSRGVDDWEAKKPKNGELGEPGVGRRGLRDLLVLAVVGPGPPRGQLRTRGPESTHPERGTQCTDSAGSWDPGRPLCSPLRLCLLQVVWCPWRGL